jgi:TRAP transporter TAXI family solute receptor
MKKYIIILLSVIFLVTFSSAISAADVFKLRVAGGGLKGQWFATCTVLAEIVASEDPTIKIDVVPGAGLSNPARVGSGEIEMAMSFPPFTNTAVNGVAPFKEAYPDIRGIMKGFGPSLLQFVVTADTGLKTVDDLIDQKYPINLATERKGTTDEYSCAKILEFYGINYDTIKKWGGSIKFVGYGDQVILVKDKHANAVFQNIAAPSSSVIEMSSSKDLVVLAFSDELVKYMNEKYAYSIGVIPKGTYGVVEEDLKSPASIASWIVNKDVPEDVVYRITKIICENADKVRKIHPSTVSFDPTQACFDLGAPLHPGAERYFKEMGYLK